MVSICIDVTLFGVSVVFMILAATNLNAVFSEVPALHFSPCYWMMVVAVLLTPFVWLGTPKDFWLVLMGGQLLEDEMLVIGVLYLMGSLILVLVHYNIVLRISCC